MTDFTSLIADAVAAKMTPEFIEKEVGARVDKLLVESVDSALRSYSDTGKQIREAVENALRVEGLDLPTYGQVVAQMLKVQIEDRVSALVSGQLAKDMDELLSLAPREVKLSEIAKQMLDEHADDEWGDLITVIVEDDTHGYSRVYLDERGVYEERDKYKCRYRLGVDGKGKIYSASIDDRDLKSSQHIGRSYGVGQMIRAYVACGTTIILDVDSVATGKADY